MLLLPPCLRRLLTLTHAQSGVRAPACDLPCSPMPRYGLAWRTQVYEAGVLARLDAALLAWGELAELRRKLAR